MDKTPILERIERWVALGYADKQILVHEDDVEDIVKQKLYKLFSQPFKILGKDEMFGGKLDGSL